MKVINRNVFLDRLKKGNSKKIGVHYFAFISEQIIQNKQRVPIRLRHVYLLLNKVVFFGSPRWACYLAPVPAMVGASPVYE